MELINNSAPPSNQESSGGNIGRLKDSILSLSLKNMEEKLKSINEIDGSSIKKTDRKKQIQLAPLALGDGGLSELPLATSADDYDINKRRNKHH